MRYAAYAVMLLALATLLPWLATAPMSLMAFDNGGSPMAYTVVGLMFAYPVWLLYWLWKARKTQNAGDDKGALLRALLGAAPVLVIIAVITGGSFARH